MSDFLKKIIEYGSWDFLSLLTLPLSVYIFWMGIKLQDRNKRVSNKNHILLQIKTFIEEIEYFIEHLHSIPVYGIEKLYLEEINIAKKSIGLEILEIVNKLGELSMRPSDDRRNLVLRLNIDQMLSKLSMLEIEGIEKFKPSEPVRVNNSPEWKLKNYYKGKIHRTAMSKYFREKSLSKPNGDEVVRKYTDLVYQRQRKYLDKNKLLIKIEEILNEIDKDLSRIR